MPPLPDLILYGRPACALCDETRAILERLLERRRSAGLTAPRLVERDIDADASWQRAYFASIPVVVLGERRLDLATSASALQRLLAEGLDA
ncbi:MAG: glutaredoxin family protein [Candidatus Limnocylindria bacterium]